MFDGKYCMSRNSIFNRGDANDNKFFFYTTKNVLQNYLNNTSVTHIYMQHKLEILYRYILNAIESEQSKNISNRLAFWKI